MGINHTLFEQLKPDMPNQICGSNTIYYRFKVESEIIGTNTPGPTEFRYYNFINIVTSFLVYDINFVMCEM